MRIEISETTQGLPQVAWIQSTSETGATLGAQRFRFGIGAGLIGGFLVGLHSGDLRMIFAGPLVGALAMMAAIGHAEKERGGPEKDGAAPILDEQYCEARIERDGDELVLVWSLNGRTTADQFVVGLAEVTELVLGNMNEWFGAKSSVEKMHESFVIVMPLADGRVLRLADHAGRQSEVAELHAVLSQVLIAPRKQMLRALAAELRERELGAPDTDVPASF